MIELLLVDKIVSGFWRLKRALSLEKDEVLERSIFDKKLRISKDVDPFFRYEIMLDDVRKNVEDSLTNKSGGLLTESEKEYPIRILIAEVIFSNFGVKKNNKLLYFQK